jgi:hypothetical protein
MGALARSRPGAKRAKQDPRRIGALARSRPGAKRAKRAPLRPGETAAFPGLVPCPAGGGRRGLG